MSSPLITVITPTYNRCHTLPQLYKSLCEQTDKNFMWMIVDDGSTDTTEALVQGFIREKKIVIEYIYQKNGGKHRALNKGIPLIESELTFIVDSDDYLTPNAISSIVKDWDSNKNWCGISYLRGYTEEDVIGDKFSNDYEVNHFHEIRVNQHIEGDKAEVWRTDLLKEEPFLEYEGERFFGEGYVWIRLSKKYPMLFVNKIIYITEYLEGGLTRSGRKLRIMCPLGGMDHANSMIDSDFRMKIRIKYSWLFCAYGFFAKKSLKEIFDMANSRKIVCLNWPFGFLLYLYWKKKYL